MNTIRLLHELNVAFGLNLVCSMYPSPDGYVGHISLDGVPLCAPCDEHLLWNFALDLQARIIAGMAAERS